MSNVFALGVALFSMIVYRKIIPANAIDSLIVLASGLVILVFVDYVTKGIRTHYLSVAGVSSDLTLGDRIFSQVMDLKYKSKNCWADGRNIKKFENESFASAALTGLIDVPFSLILFLLFILLVLAVAPVLIAILLNVVATLYIQ